MQANRQRGEARPVAMLAATAYKEREAGSTGRKVNELHPVMFLNVTHSRIEWKFASLTHTRLLLQSSSAALYPTHTHTLPPSQFPNVTTRTLLSGDNWHTKTFPCFDEKNSKTEQRILLASKLLLMASWARQLLNETLARCSSSVDSDWELYMLCS